MRAVLVKVLLSSGIALALTGAVSSDAQCANNGVSGPSQAPVGHRQPSARDVPEQDTSADSATKKLDQELDRKLRSICRGC
jgi:hypothetical protein